MKQGRAADPGTPAVHTARVAPKLYDGSVVLDAPAHVPVIWGRGEDVLWSEGEPLIVAGPPGVGKTTLVQQVVLNRAGIADGDLSVLGYMVRPDPERRVLYIAADRPSQALRSMRRMVEPRHRELLIERLLIWRGPYNALENPESQLADFRDWGVGTVAIDSIKDVAGDISKGDVGQEFNAFLQTLVAGGIEVVANHHPRKAQEGNRKPNRLDDLYGSQWLAAGAGSVVYLHGEAGDTVVKLLHLKQPAGVVGPLTVVHDHARGVSAVPTGESALDGLTTMQEGSAREVAARTLGTSNPSRSEVQRVRRQLDKLTESGDVERRQEGESETSTITYCVKRVKQGREAVSPASREASNGLSREYAELHGLHEAEEEEANPLKGGRTPEREANNPSDDEAAPEELRSALDGEWEDQPPPGEGAEVSDFRGRA